jgi:ribonucleoside-diphosphate reductase alpha chain
VIRKHRLAVNDIDPSYVPKALIQAAKQAWDEALASGQEHGFKNAQVSVLAPTGTIGFMMDCDTTGIEPDIALVKYKKLVGGGMLKIVNNTVPEALTRLGYSEDQVKGIVSFIDENETIEGAPDLQEKHLPIFDCAFKPMNGTRSIQWLGHIKMMGAVQPFLSGAISKTVNMPTDCTVEDIQQAYIEAWKAGLKALAVYRDGSKRSQPLNTSKDGGKEAAKPGGIGSPTRRRLADERKALTHKFSIGGHEGYITVGLYEDGAPGEIFITMAKEGSVVSGLVDSVATLTSIALQYGVPLNVLCNKFAHTRFEPSGFTNNPQIPIAKSIMDYIFRWLQSRFLNVETASESQIEEAKDSASTGLVTEVKALSEAKQAALSKVQSFESQVFQAQSDAPPCSNCGAIMVRNGACYKCLNCGGTSGCS